MDGTVRHRLLRGHMPNGRLVCGLLVALTLLSVACFSLASDSPFSTESADAQPQNLFIDQMDGANVSWAVDPLQSGATVLEHQRQSKQVHSGTDAEEARIQFKNVGSRCAIYRAVPATQLQEGLTASLWVRTPIRGATLALGVTFPNQIDPRTRSPLFAPIFSPPSSGEGEWEELRIKLDPEQISSVQTRLRAVMHQEHIDPQTIDLTGAYIDQMVLYLPTTIGTGVVQWDTLSYGPIVPPSQVVTPPTNSSQRGAALSWSDNRILANGQPIIPRFITYQGEATHLLKSLRVNSVWLPNTDSPAVMTALASEQLHIMATPPEPPASSGVEMASMRPFEADTNLVTCWMLGRLDSKNLEQVANWSEQVQDADPLRRMVLGDVPGHVREFHRYMPLLSTSRHIIHTSLSPQDYWDVLEQRRMQALPGRPMSTLLPTEPSEAARISRRANDAPLVMEPEQISLSTHLAAAAGYKLFGFWTRTAINSDGPGMEERRQILKLVNLELQLLEPWLATGTIVKSTEAKTEAMIAQSASSRPKGMSFNPFSSALTRPPEQDGPRSPYRATILRGTPGMLILVDCVEEGAQFQPGAMLQSNLRFTTTRHDDTPTAFEVTTTSVKQIELDLQPVAGGMEVKLKDFNEHAAIVMTSDPEQIEILRREVRAVAQEAATAWLALASTKLARVERVQAELQEVSPAVPDAARTLQSARRFLQQADIELQGGRFDEARRNCQQVMALTRMVQRAYWDLAVKSLSSPVASPHATCFQTLPDHWRMVRRLTQAPSAGENLLRSGDFEDPDAIQTQWQLKADPQLANPVSLNTRAARGRFSLALTARPTREQGRLVDDPLITLYSPSVTVHSGQLVRITGKVLIPRELTGSVDGLMIYDTLKGSVSAHRFRKATPPGQWQTFEIYRDVTSSGEFKMVFELQGWGEVWLDDLQINTVEPDSEIQAASATR